MATVTLFVGAFVMPATSIGAVAAVAPGVVQLSDSRIKESSGLVDLGPIWVTTNDSGDSARLFVVSPKTGRTIGLVTYRATVRDVEALAPAGRNAVWVGDIGDNTKSRRSISVFRVTVGTGRVEMLPRRFRLVYPGGRPNAESLFVDRQGRLHVVTKTIQGGVVLRAPARLSSAKPNRLTVVGRVREYATDAAATRDRRHVIVRGPEIAGVYTVPGFKRVGSLRLPPQPQGEGIAVGPTGEVRVSSEGARTAVRRISIPAALRRVIDPAASPAASPSTSPAPSPSVSPSSSPSPSPSESAPAPTPRTDPASRDSSEDRIGGIDPPWLVWCIPAVIALGALGIGLGLRRQS